MIQSVRTANALALASTLDRGYMGAMLRAAHAEQHALRVLRRSIAMVLCYAPALDAQLRSAKNLAPETMLRASKLLRAAKGRLALERKRASRRVQGT